MHNAEWIIAEYLDVVIDDAARDDRSQKSMPGFLHNPWRSVATSLTN
jgi:hypothetical protein